MDYLIAPTNGKPQGQAMTIEDIKAAIKATPKGANIIVEWTRPVKLRKAYKGMPLTVSKSMLCRLGVQYDNTAATKQGRDDGSLPATNAGLKGVEWIQFPILLKAVKSQKIQLRLQAGTFNSFKTENVYKLDNQTVEKADWEHTMLASETKKRAAPTAFNIGIEAITRIHTHSIPEEIEVEAAAPEEVPF